MLIRGQRNGLAFAGYRQFLAPDGTEGGSLPKDDADIDKLEVPDAEKTRLKGERAIARKAVADAAAAATAQADMQKQLDALQAAEQKRIADAATQAEADREKAGEHEALAKTRAEERDKARADLAELQGRFDSLHKIALDATTPQFKALPEEVRDFFDGEETDPLALITFMGKSKKMVDKLAETAAAATSQNTEGNPALPKDGSTSTVTAITDEQAREQMRRSYS